MARPITQCCLGIRGTDFMGRVYLQCACCACSGSTGGALSKDTIIIIAVAVGGGVIILALITALAFIWCALGMSVLHTRCPRPGTLLVCTSALTRVIEIPVLNQGCNGTIC